MHRMYEYLTSYTTLSVTTIDSITVPTCFTRKTFYMYAVLPLPVGDSIAFHQKSAADKAVCADLGAQQVFRVIFYKCMYVTKFYRKTT